MAAEPDDGDYDVQANAHCQAEATEDAKWVHARAGATDLKQAAAAPRAQRWPRRRALAQLATQFWLANFGPG